MQLDQADASLIIENLNAVRARIARACVSAGRDPDTVRLLLATKTVPAERISVAIRGGASLIGENRAQELIEKAPALDGCGAEKHFIGHVQSNKIRRIAALVSCVQSIDCISTAEKFDRVLEETGRVLDVFIQVNTSGEDSKFGVPPEDALAFTRVVAGFAHLRVRGLMTIGLLSPDPERCRPGLRMLTDLRERIRDAGIENADVTELSMGMSTDLELAIQEGATMVRIGTAVFGRRPTPEGFFWNENAQRS
jgi:hypothetical protein